MRNKTFIFVCSFFAFTVVFFSANVWAQNLTERYSNRTMQGVRPLGMGNAFTAVKGTDENVIFYNPAAINDYPKEVHMQFLLPTVEISYKAINFFTDDILNLADDIDAAATDSAKIDVLDAFAAANTGRYEEVNARGNLATFMHKYITASLFYENRSVIALTNPSSSTVDVEVLTQAGLVAGSAYSFFDDHLQVGLAAKFLARHLIDETITQRDVITNAQFDDILSYKDVGYGVGADIGLKFRLPMKKSYKVWDYLDPVFALTVQDIGHTRFFMGDDVGRQKESTTFGFALHPNYWKLTSILAVDVRDLEYASDFINKFHVGYEITWPDISKVLRSASVRIGCNQGYLAGGFGLDFRYFKLNAATYGRELAERTYQKQSRMFSLQLAAGF